MTFLTENFSREIRDECVGMKDTSLSVVCSD